MSLAKEFIETKWKQELSEVVSHPFEVRYVEENKQLTAIGNYKTINKISRHYKKMNRGLERKMVFSMVENVYRDNEFLFFLSVDPNLKVGQGSLAPFLHY